MTSKDKPDEIPLRLLTRIREQCETPVDNEIEFLLERIKSLYPGSVKSIFLYGSCLRNQDYSDGIVDLYVIVDNYRHAYKRRRSSLLNSFLPPNVYYLEVNNHDRVLRAKYAVISLEDLRDGIDNWFHSYLWSRFAQPVRLVYTDIEDTKLLLYRYLGASVIKYLHKTLPALGEGHFNSEQIWVNALSLSYAAELRPERLDRVGLITAQNISELDSLTLAAVPALAGVLEINSSGDFIVQSNKKTQGNCIRLWRIRRLQGRILSVCRLVKAVFTFKDAVNYAAWKIERHTGITIEVTPVLQRHPILFGFTTLWRLLRRDVLH